MGSKEPGHADQEIAQQRLRFSWVLGHVVAVLHESSQLVDLQAPLEPAHQRRALVLAEIVAGARAQHREDVAHRLFRLDRRVFGCRSIRQFRDRDRARIAP